MGKHSNIIFCDENDKILDSIKHVPASVSSIREVLPGREYFIPVQEGKINPDTISEDYFKETILKKPTSISKALVSSIIGMLYSSEILYSKWYFLENNIKKWSFSNRAKYNATNTIIINGINTILIISIPVLRSSEISPCLLPWSYRLRQYMVSLNGNQNVQCISSLFGVEYQRQELCR